MKKINRTNFVDIILILFAVYLFFTTNWSNMDSFSQLLLLMYTLCIILRIGNMMKIKQKEIAKKQKEEQEQTKY